MAAAKPGTLTLNRIEARPVVLKRDVRDARAASRIRSRVQSASMAPNSTCWCKLAR
jgi:hypothetical protein